MRILEAAAAAMICTAAGAVFSSALRRRCTELRAVMTMTDEMAAKIRYRSVRMSELITEVTAGDIYRGSSFACLLMSGVKSGMTSNDAWCRAAEKAPFLTDNDREILRSIGNGLGETDTEGQLSMLALAGSMLSRSLEQAEDERARRSRMLLSVWTMCGIGAGIIII